MRNARESANVSFPYLRLLTLIRHCLVSPLRDRRDARDIPRVNPHGLFSDTFPKRGRAVSPTEIRKEVHVIGEKHRRKRFERYQQRKEMRNMNVLRGMMESLFYSSLTEPRLPSDEPPPSFPPSDATEETGPPPYTEDATEPNPEPSSPTDGEFQLGRVVARQY